MSLGKRLSALPRELVKHHVIPHIGALSMMIARHVLLGHSIARNDFHYNDDAYRNGFEFFMWCWKNLVVKLQEISAGRYGDIEIIQWMIDHDMDMNYVLQGVTIHDRLQEFQFVYTRLPEIPDNAMSIAAYYGSIKIMQYLIDLGYSINDNDAIAAADSGSLAALKLVHANNAIYDERLIWHAVLSGSIECVQYLRMLDYDWDSDDCSAAARKGSLAILQYLHDNGCPWDARVTGESAMAGALDCLQYAHEHGCPWNESTCPNAVEFYNTQPVNDQDELDEVVSRILECLRYAHENGCPWDKYTCTSAAALGVLEILQYAHENGCPWDSDVCYDAILYDRPVCFRYVHENGCPLGPGAFYHAAKHSLECLKYLVNIGCLFDKTVLAQTLSQEKQYLSVEHVEYIVALLEQDEN